MGWGGANVVCYRGNLAFLVLTPGPVSSVGEVEVDVLSTPEGFLRKVEEENGAAPWAPNTQQALITKYRLETRRIPSHTHTVPSFVVAAAKWLFAFSAGCFYLPALCCSPLMKGSAYGGGSSQRRAVSAARRNIKEARSCSPSR